MYKYRNEKGLTCMYVIFYYYEIFHWRSRVTSVHRVEHLQALLLHKILPPHQLLKKQVNYKACIQFSAHDDHEWELEMIG